ncbi:MAG TPA: hypothetical protein VMM77_00315 [Gemmatimonadaceae bacterium]|nr:hypothetical protein [Gemmatimonadaceae bacterium]
MQPQDAPLYTSEHAVPHEPDARWLARRARNVARRPMLLLLLAGAGFLVALISVVAVSRGVGGLRRPVVPALPARADTTLLARQSELARIGIAGAEAALAGARARALAEPPAPVVIDTFSPALIRRRESLSASARVLAAALRRATDAPLPASYRALAESPSVAGDLSGTGLLDSLAAVERARAEYEALGIVDTVFIALTGRMTQIGDSIRGIAGRRLAEIRREVARLQPEIHMPEPAPEVDTIPFGVALDSARAALTAAERGLASARSHNDSVARLEAQAAQFAVQPTSPLTLIAAASVLGVVFGFLIALGGEMRRPRVADSREAEVAAGAPVLALITVDRGSSLRTRRRADRDVPPLIDLVSDRYERLYYRLADNVARLPRIAVFGDETAVVATVAANLAAAAARSARSTLLLDTDFDSRSVTSVMRVRSAPGVAEVLARRVHWSSAVTPAIVGRDRIVDVLPAGSMKGGGSLAGAVDGFRTEIDNISRRYDALIVSAPVSRRGAASAVSASVPDAIVCVCVSRTPVRALQRIVTEARADGSRIRGLVVWSMDTPDLDVQGGKPGDRSSEAPERERQLV